MHLRINDVTVSPQRIDELGDVLTNKALPVVVNQKGCQGLLCVADRTSGDCAIVSLWESQKSLEASEKAIGIIRTEVIDALDARLNSINIAEIVREVGTRPSQVGNRSRAVRITGPVPAGKQLIEFYDKEAVPRLEAQAGFVNARLIRDVENQGRFVAVSHWQDVTALNASEANSTALREQVTKAVPGASIERVTTSEVILVERMP